MIYNTKFENYINYFIENPLKTWWKCRKYFKRPKISIHFFISPLYNCPYASYKWIGKIIDISCVDVYWKTKYDDIRYERPPYIWVCFFKRFGFSINFNTYFRNEFNEKCNFNEYYWDYLLTYLYRNNDLSKVPTYIGTSKIYKQINPKDDSIKFVDSVVQIVQYSLTKKGIKQLKYNLKSNKHPKHLYN